MIGKMLRHGSGGTSGKNRVAKRFGWVLAGLLGATSMPAQGAVRIDFSDSTPPGVAGFRISRNTPTGMSNVLEIGQDSGSTRNLTFLRINTSTSSTSGTDVLNFIVALPSFRIGARTPSGTGIDFYDITFDDGTTTRPGGFQVFNPANLVTPVMTATLSLPEHMLLTFGSSGAIESTVAVNLTNVQVAIPALTTLTEFKAAADAGGGADFAASITTSGTNLSQQIMNGATVTGAAAGSINAPVPEPGSVLLLALGAALIRRRRRNA